MDYRVNIDADVGTAAASDTAGDRLLDALCAAHPDAAVSQDTRSGRIGAAFVLDAADADQATLAAQRIFAAALTRAGLTGTLAAVTIDPT